MAYQISDTCDIKSTASDSKLLLSNPTTTWSLRNNVIDNKFILENQSLPNIFDIDPLTGDAEFINNVRLIELKLRSNSGFNTNLLPSAGLVADYNVTFPTIPPSTNQTILYNGSNYVWQDFFSTTNNKFVVTTNPDPTQFPLISAAIAALPFVPTINNSFVIYVEPGLYNEPATVVVPDFVYITGIDMQGCIIQPLNTGYDLFKFGRGGLAFMQVQNVLSPNYAFDMTDCGDFSLFHKVTTENCERGFNCAATTIDCVTYLEYVDLTGSPTSEVSLSISSTLPFTSNVNIENFFTFEHFTNHITVDGIGSDLLGQGCSFQGDITSTFMLVTNSGNVELRGFLVKDFNNGISVPTDGGTPNLLMVGGMFNNNVMEIDVQEVGTTGYYFGSSTYTKVFINPLSLFFIQNKNLRQINVAKKGGDFSSVKAAVDFITGNTATTPFVITVAPGVYIENNMTLKSFVSIVGLAKTTCVIQALTNGVLIDLQPSSYIFNMTINSTNVPGNISVRYQGGVGSVLLQDVIFVTSETHISLNSTVGINRSIINNIIFFTNGTFKTGIDIQDNGTNSMVSLIEGVIWAPTTFGNFTNLIYTKSIAASVITNIIVSNVDVSQTTLPGQGSSFTIEGPVNFTLVASTIKGLDIGVNVPNLVVLAPTLFINSTTLDMHVTNDILITNPNTTGSVAVNANISMVSISSDNIGVIVDDINGSISLGGDLFQGRVQSEVTNISEMLQLGGNMGVLSHTSGVITLNAGLNVDISNGTGYLTITSTPPNYIRYITWTSATIMLTDNTLNWIIVNNAGTVTSTTSEPDPIETIILGSVYTNSGTVDYIQAVHRDAHNTGTLIDTTLRDAIGPIFGSGCLASPGSVGLKVSVTSGIYYFSTKSYSPSLSADITMLGYYRDGVGGYVLVTLTDVPLLWDNNSGTLQSITILNWVKHALYVVGDGVNQKYLFVYGQEQFSSELNAQNGNLPTPPSFFDNNVVSIAAIVVTNTDVVLTSGRFIDIRPTLSFRSGGTTVSSDHNSLNNLTVGNAHPQYLRRDGTDGGMNADLNMNSNNITTVGTVNGVTVETHAFRHLPGGADPLTTAIAVDVAQANVIGVANSFARSDHVHNHGSQPSNGTNHAAVTTVVNGFMIAADKLKLDDATSAPTANTLALRDGSANINFANIGIFNATANRTITLASPNTLAANITYQLPPADGLNGTVLTTNGAGVTTWSAVASSNPTTTAGDLPYRDPSNVYNRLPIGAQGMYLRSTTPTTIAWSQNTLPSRETIIFDDFLSANTNNGDTNWSTANSGGGSGFTRPGGVANDTDLGFISLNVQAATSTVQINKDLSLLRFGLGPFYSEFRCKVLTNILNTYSVRIGFLNTSIATPTIGAYWELNGVTLIGAANWNVVCRQSAILVTSNVGPAFDTNWHVFGINYNMGLSRIEFYYDGVLTNFISTNIPNSASLRCGPAVQVIKLVGTTANSIYFDYFYMNYQFTNPR
jgi:hypothetical protein